MLSEIKEIGKLKREKVLSNTDDIFYAGTEISDDFTFAVYECPSCGSVQISNRGEDMYCAVCGEGTDFVSEVSAKSLQEAKVDYKKMVCPICNTTMVTSKSEDEDLYCVQCGAVVSGDDADDDLDVEVDLEEEEEEGEKATSISLNPITSKDTFTKSSVKMVLHDPEGENPYWNIILDGMPTARVSLKDQPNPDEIRDVFTSDVYAENLAEAIEKLGAKAVLDQIKAKYYVNKVDESKLAERLEKKVKADLDKENKKALGRLRQEYADCIKLVLAGLNKNFFPDVDNPLKASLWSAMERNGVFNPSEVIESCFRESADEFFDIVLSKAESYMEKDPEVRNEIAKAIRDADVIVKEDVNRIQKAGEEEPDLRDRLAQSNVNVNLLGITDNKESLRARLQLNKKV